MKYDRLPDHLLTQLDTPVTRVRQQMRDEALGIRFAVPWPFPAITQGTKALLPGTVTLVCGMPGSAKSWFMIQCVVHWVRARLRVAMLELESDREFHLRRALAQIASAPQLTDDTWCKENHDQADYLLEQNAPLLEDVAASLYDAPDKAMSTREILSWISEMATKGARLICIDPITAMEPSKEPWIDDTRLLVEARKIIRKTGSSLVLVTHPKKGVLGGDTSLDSLAGGAGYQRFSDTVLWIKSLHPPEDKQCVSPMGTTTFPINRTVHIYKARSGMGTGWEIGFDFAPSSLTFIERGLVVSDE